VLSAIASSLLDNRVPDLTDFHGGLPWHAASNVWATEASGDTGGHESDARIQFETC
jgi:hypothetical protein